MGNAVIQAWWVGVLVLLAGLARADYTLDTTTHQDPGAAQREIRRWQERGYAASSRTEAEGVRLSVGRYASEDLARQAGIHFIQEGWLSRFSIRDLGSEQNLVPDGSACQVIHVSSYRAEGAAVRDVETWRGEGLKSFHRLETVAGGEWYRVYLGPFISETEARATLARFRSAGRIDYFRMADTCPAPESATPETAIPEVPTDEPGNRAASTLSRDGSGESETVSREVGAAAWMVEPVLSGVAEGGAGESPPMGISSPADATLDEEGLSVPALLEEKGKHPQPPVEEPVALVAQPKPPKSSSEPVVAPDIDVVSTESQRSPTLEPLLAEPSDLPAGEAEEKLPPMSTPKILEALWPRPQGPTVAELLALPDGVHPEPEDGRPAPEEATKKTGTEVAAVTAEDFRLSLLGGFYLVTGVDEFTVEWLDGNVLRDAELGNGPAPSLAVDAVAQWTERLGVYAGAGWARGSTVSLMVFSAGLEYTVSRHWAIVPYLRGGGLYGRFDWSEAPGTFSPTWGWELGAGAHFPLGTIRLGGYVAYRNLNFDYDGGNEPTLSVTSDSLDLSGFLAVASVSVSL